MSDTVKHICGAQGFGRDTSDRCPACDQAFSEWQKGALRSMAVRLDTHTCQLCGNSYSGKHVCPAFYGDGCGPAFDADGEPIQRPLATADIPASRRPAPDAAAMWDDEDNQNIVGLIRICEDLKTRLVPYGASPKGWDSALTTLHRVKRLAQSARRSVSEGARDE